MIGSYANRQDAAAEFGLSVSTLTRMVQRGEVRAVRVGVRLLIDCRALRLHLDAMPSVVLKADRPSKPIT